MNKIGTNGQRSRRFQVYENGQMVATVRAVSAREAAKQFLVSNPSARSCTIGEPGGPEKWGYIKSERFDENPNRMAGFSPRHKALF